MNITLILYHNGTAPSVERKNKEDIDYEEDCFRTPDCCHAVLRRRFRRNREGRRRDAPEVQRRSEVRDRRRQAPAPHPPPDPPRLRHEALPGVLREEGFSVRCAVESCGGKIKVKK